MGHEARNATLRETRRTNRDLAHISRLMKGVTSEYQVDAMIRREMPTASDEDRRAVKKLMMTFLEGQCASNA